MFCPLPISSCKLQTSSASLHSGIAPDQFRIPNANLTIHAVRNYEKNHKVSEQGPSVLLRVQLQLTV